MIAFGYCFSGKTNQFIMANNNLHIPQQINQNGGNLYLELNE